VVERPSAEANRPGAAAATADLFFRVTPRQLQVLAAVVATGTYKGAAFELGVRRDTVRNHLVKLRRSLGVDTTWQAVYLLTASGDLIVPGFGRPPGVVRTVPLRGA